MRARSGRNATATWLEPFEPISDLGRGAPAVEPARSINRLQLPYVVRQVLDQATTTWERFAEAIYSRCKEGGLKTLLVTGNERLEGYSTVSMALAVALAMKDDLRVALLDADFSAPSLARQLRVVAGGGRDLVDLGEPVVGQGSACARQPARLGHLAGWILRLGEVPVGDGVGVEAAEGGDHVLGRTTPASAVTPRGRTSSDGFDQLFDLRRRWSVDPAGEWRRLTQSL